MNKRNKKRNIEEEIQRADEILKASLLLAEKTYFSDAVSRLYYFLLHYIRALLLTKELEPRSHEGALRLLSLHFVKEGILTPSSSHIFSKLMKYREEADYNPSYVFTQEDFTLLQKEAKKLTREIRTYLKKKAYL